MIKNGKKIIIPPHEPGEPLVDSMQKIQYDLVTMEKVEAEIKEKKRATQPLKN